MSLAEDIKQHAMDLGFDLVGITDASEISSDHRQYLTNFLDNEFEASMSFMQRNLEKRTNPSKLMENAKSVIVVALNYKPSTPPPLYLPNIKLGKVATYAQYEDYHVFIKKQLRQLAGFLISKAGTALKFKICVDSVPLAERALAQRAGLGFIARNHMLTNPKLGSQLFLAELITNLPLPADKPMKDTCQNCDKCIKSCPTGALRSDGQFDASKCISYLTIEHKGNIAEELAKKIGNHVFGCDECILACPYQHKAPICKNKSYCQFPDLSQLDLDQILNMNQYEFDMKFAQTPISRTGLESMKRNAKICIENIQQKAETFYGARKTSVSHEGISTPL